VCQSELDGKRNLVLESIVQGFPDKIECKFEACDFKNMSEETAKAHEEECANRYVPCGLCDRKITLKSIEEHGINHNGNHISQVTFAGFGIPKEDLSVYPRILKKMQIVYKVKGEDSTFIFNLNSDDSGPTTVWISCISPRKSLAKGYKYTLQVPSGEDAGKVPPVYTLEGTRRCVPCDMSCEEVQKSGCHLLLDEETIADAIGRNNKLKLIITISKV